MCVSLSNAFDTGAGVVTITPWKYAGLRHQDIIEEDVEHRIGGITNYHSWTQLRSIDSDIT